MIIWLNGSFGAGKTQTAYELHRRIPHSYVYDPENIGYFIRKNIPRQMDKADFQDHPMWRSFNLELLDYIASQYQGNIIVPMTITNRAYFDEIIGELSKRHQVKHFILWATKEALLKRLASRLEGRSSWAARQIDRCLNAFETDITECKVYTDDLNICETAEKIAELSGITLLKDRRSGVRKSIDRLITKYRHIR